LNKIIDKTKSEIKNKNATKEFLRGIGSALMSMGISLTSNLLTPGIMKILEI
jgi:hypothetical protein